MEASTKHIFNYSFIAMPIAFASVPIYIFLPDYYHQSFGVNLTLLSVVLFSLRILDALLDPFIGWYCDKFQSYEKVSFVVIILAFIIGVTITCSPIFSNKLINLFIGIFLATISFSYLTIFVATKGALWLKSDDDKSTIISVRETFNITGVLIASVLPFILLIFFSQKTSYLIYSIVASILIILASIFFIKWLNTTKVANKNIHAFKISSYIKAFDRDGVFLFIAYIMSALGSAIPAVTLVFFSRYILDTAELTGLYIFVYFLGAILFIPFIKKLAMKIGIIKTWGLALIFCVLVFAFALLLGKGDTVGFSVISFLAGAGFASELILPSILLAKWIDCKERKNLGNGYYAILAFLGKFCFALATIIALPLLNSQLNNSDNHLEIILKIIYCLFPCIAKLSAAVVLFIWYRKINSVQ
ncbi:MFS transporter [Francisella sp. Scap27]|uniref:MFS transporter n=1 Tax=Francisella sp. Scap27 TaxID=2589986 RepID=UPI0015C05CF3|nr:MFS transporter [Francisella sp. Scap27]QLE78309.1 MFS transporter [Francisella sp. Scap27]